MRYTVVWSSDAEDDLCEYWIAGGSLERRFLTELSHRIDNDLSMSPERLGTSVGSDEFLRQHRFYFLGADVLVEFRVSADDRIARVLRITAK